VLNNKFLKMKMLTPN